MPKCAMGQRTVVGHQPVVIGALVTVALACITCAPTKNASSVTLPWDLKVIGAPAAWQVTEGEGEVIAILDSGLSDEALPELRKREVIPLPTADGVNLPFAPDIVGHGTAVTTLAAGSGDLGVWGVAPRARVMPFNVTDASGGISQDAVVFGIHAAVDEGASVINMSFGSVSDSVRVREAIHFAAMHGVIIVAAGGDTAAPAPLFPADVLDEVIAVRALNEKGAPPLRANTVGANGIDAPGENLLAVRIQNHTAVAVGSDGSSMAAALVSGSVSLFEACIHRKSGFVLGQPAVVHALRDSARGGPWFNLRIALREVGC